MLGMITGMTPPSSTQPARRISTADALFARASKAYAAAQYGEAASLYRHCTVLNPAQLSAWMNLASALRRLGHFDSSILAAQRALALAPDHAGCLTNLGNTLIDASRIDEGLDAQRRAYALAPDDTLIRRNLAVALREARLFGEALGHIEELLRFSPDDGNLEWERALCLLYQGDYAQGWPAFEARWKLPAMTARWPQIARWQGQDISGQHLLVTEEQGFGDTILCSRYLPALIARAGSVTLACKKPLHLLLRDIAGLQLTTIEDTDTAIARGTHTYDCQVTMMSLPGIFKTTFDTIPAPAPLHSAENLPAPIKAALASAGKRLKVGIVWSGSVTFGNNRKRATTAGRFAQLAAIDNVEVYSLQKGPREHDLRAAGMNAVIHEIGPLLNNFAETAAVLKQLDLVIMTDSSVAHLAGSLGVPVWNLLHDCPYWLYLHAREDSPWYPSMRLYRQQSPGDWDELFTRVSANLRQIAKQKD